MRTLTKEDPMGQITVAQALARLLDRMGTEYVFGVNGHGNWALLDALVHETRIKGVPARAADHAGQMADGYWRIRRQAPLSIVTTSVGPGNANIVSALAGAFYESVAMLVFAGSGSTHWFDRGGIEEAYRYGPEEWTQIVRPISKKAVLVTRPDTAVDMFLRAYRTAIAGRPGPVVLQVPFDIQHTSIPDTLPDPRPWTAWHPPAPDPAGVAEAVAVLGHASRPLLVVGSGVHSARAWDELCRLAEGAQIPVVTTPSGKGAFPEGHSLALGCIGRAGAGHANEAARRSDVVVAVGTHFTDMDTGGWTLFDIPARTRLIHLDIDETELGRVYPAEVALGCDARLGLAALAAAAGQPPPDRAGWLAELAELRRAWEASVDGDRHSEIAPLHYARVCHEVGEVVGAVDPEMPVFFDTGHLLHFGPPFLGTSSRHVAHAGFYHRMGWSASAIIGASLARGRSRALALLGDGSFLMGGTALATAVEQDLPLTWVVLSNRSLQIERESMLRLYGRESFCDYRLTRTGELWNPDFVKWAEAMGARGVKVTRPGELGGALRRALDSRAPFVVDVDVDIEQKGYRAVWYPYPANFHETWPRGPAAASTSAPTAR
jgi:acetolactate synthase-1/2/3 large subunit